MAKKKIRWDRIFLVALAVVAVVVLVWQLQSNSNPQTNNVNLSEEETQQNMIDTDAVYLTIGERDFTYGELNAQYQRLDADTRAFYSLDEFVEAGIVPSELLLNEARKAGIEVNQSVVDEQVSYISDMADQQGMTFQQYVEMFGFDEQSARNQIRDEVIIQAYLDQTIDSNISVTEEEIEALYVQWGIEQQNLTLEEVRADLEEMAVSEKYSALVQEHLADLRNIVPIVYHFSAGSENVESENLNIESIDEDEMVVNQEVDIVNESGDVKEFRLTGHMFYFADSDGNENPEIRVQAGDRVRIVFDNVEGIHDWIVDEIEGAYTNLLQPGQSQTIEFTATEAGEFEYYCSYMQHREMGMFGTIIVE